MKKTLTISASICLLSILIITHSYQFWRFTTGTNIPIFLDTTFGMSLSESQQALKKNDIKLLARNEFASLNPQIENKFPRDLFEENVIAEDKIKMKDIKYYYMPSIQMFDSEVAAEFEFTKNKLTDVDVRVFPLSYKMTSLIIEKITNELTRKYTFIRKEYGNEWEIVGEKPDDNPSAYRLEFQGKETCAVFWINTTDIKNPSLSISFFMKINDDCAQSNSIKIKNREENAF